MEQRVCSNSQDHKSRRRPFARVDNVVQRGPTSLTKEDEATGRAGESKVLDVNPEL